MNKGLGGETFRETRRDRGETFRVSRLQWEIEERGAGRKALGGEMKHWSGGVMGSDQEET